MTTEDDLQDMLDRSPEDWQTRLVLADFLRETGDPRADGYEAAARLRLHPSVSKGRGQAEFATVGGLNHPNAHETHWFAINRDWLFPTDWFLAMGYAPGRGLDYGHDARTPIWLRENTRRELEDRIALAFLKLPPERRAELIAAVPA